MTGLLDWLESVFGQIPLPLLDVWGRFSFAIGVVLAICAFGGFTFRVGGAWRLGRERQAWDGRAVLAMPLTFLLIVGSGYIGSFIVLVPGAQTFESLKDLIVLVCLLLFGYPALITVPFAYALADLVEGVPPDFLLAWLPGYFINPACFWIAYQLLGRDPDFRRPRTWAGYAAFVALFMSIEPVLWGYICSGKFTPEFSYRTITPALLLTTNITWVIAPFAMLGALPLARRLRAFWAEIPLHVRERAFGTDEWSWIVGPDSVPSAADDKSRALPVRMYILVPFVTLMLVVVLATAYVTLKSGEDDATRLAVRLHEEIAANIDLQLDDYLDRPPTNTPVGEGIGTLLRALSISRTGRAFIVDRTRRIVASSAPAGDAVVAGTIASLPPSPPTVAVPTSQREWRFDHVTPQPSRETWLARAAPYAGRHGEHADWVIVTVMPEAYYLAGIREGNSHSAIISALALLMSVAVAALLASMVTAPIRRIARAAGALSSGDLSQRAPPSRFNELGALADSFNEMASRLTASFDELRVSALEVSRHRDHLEELVRERTHELRAAKDVADEASHAKSVFFANMSHEIRTPMNAVLGFAQVLERSTSLGAADRAHVQIILRSGEHLLSLINDVLDMAKIEAGRLTLRSSTFDLHALFDEVHRMIGLRARQKGLRFDVERASAVPRYVTLDEEKLRRILFNLLDNAVKFTSDGAVTMRMDVLSREGEARLIVEVEDTGPGIRSEEIPLVFEAFAQTAVGAASREGTGLGMPLSLEYARLMGGDLVVRSEAGRGSVFRLDIPVASAEAASVHANTGARRIIRMVGPERLRILVADDNRDNRMLIATLLDDVGLEYREVANGAEALALWETWQPHVILMDLRMPEIDGYEATRRIRSMDTGRRTKIIAVTASALDQKPERARDAGVDAFVWKPFTAEQLFEQIAAMTGHALEYADDVPAPTGENLTRDRVATVDPELRARARSAVERADARGLAHAIDEMEARDPDLADALRSLAHGYEYDRLMELL
ncbi:MAG: response regulator [Gemmatimonadota bacterium]